MAEIIDFLSAREKYKKDKNGDDIQNNEKTTSKVIKGNFSDASKSKKYAEKFLIEDNFNELIYDSIDKNTMQQVYLYLLKSNQELEQLEHELAMSVLHKNPDENESFMEHFNKQKNRDEINRIMSESVNIMLNLKDCNEHYIPLFVNLDRIMDVTMENTTGLDAVRLVLDEKANSSAEKAIKFLEEQGQYKDVVDDMIDSLIDISHDINSSNSKELMENFLRERHNAINSALPIELNQKATYLVLSKIIQNCCETLLMDQRIVKDTAQDEPTLDVFNMHRMLRLKKGEVAELIKQLQANENAMSKEEKPEVSLIYKLKPIIERLDLDRESTIAIDTYELETDFLYNIVRYEPKQITAFAQFLAKNEIQLPLCAQRMVSYLPVITKEFDDKFIDKVFIINGGGRLTKSNSFNPTKYRKEHGIVCKEKK